MPTFMTLDTIQRLMWPKDKETLKQLSIEEIQAWYLSKPKEYMVFLGQTAEFKSFVFWHYTIPVKCLRFFYKIKRMMFNV